MKLGLVVSKSGILSLRVATNCMRNWSKSASKCKGLPLLLATELTHLIGSTTRETFLDSCWRPRNSFFRFYTGILRKFFFDFTLSFVENFFRSYIVILGKFFSILTLSFSENFFLFLHCFLWKIEGEGWGEGWGEGESVL